MSIAVVLTIVYVGINLCEWPCCGRVEWLCLCCRRGQLPFQRQEGMNWLYAMLVRAVGAIQGCPCMLMGSIGMQRFSCARVAVQLGLILFNEPLLGLTYYAPAPVIKLISVAMQLTFVSLLLAYWLVEFGFLKSNPQNAGTISCCRFYAPKIAAIFVYWIMALAMYGYVLFKIETDPLYDWVAEASANTFLQLWGGIIAGLYVLYLAWLVVRVRAPRRAHAAQEWCRHTHLQRARSLCRA